MEGGVGQLSCFLLDGEPPRRVGYRAVAAAPASRRPASSAPEAGKHGVMVTERAGHAIFCDARGRAALAGRPAPTCLDSRKGS